MREQMTDLISRQAAIDAIHEDIEWLVEQGGRDLELPECMERAKTILGYLPSAEPGPCDVCVYNEDCEEMRIYCPARGREGRTDE